MRIFGYSKALGALAHYVCLICMAQVGGVLFGAALKIAAVLLFAFLLLFAIGRSAAIVKALCGCLQALATSPSSQLPQCRWERCRPDKPLPLCEPNLSSPFQRPPPLPAV